MEESLLTNTATRIGNLLHKFSSYQFFLFLFSLPFSRSKKKTTRAATTAAEKIPTVCVLPVTHVSTALQNNILEGSLVCQFLWSSSAEDGRHSFRHEITSYSFTVYLACSAVSFKFSFRMVDVWVMRESCGRRIC